MHCLKTVSWCIVFGADGVQSRLSFSNVDLDVLFEKREI